MELPPIPRPPVGTTAEDLQWLKVPVEVFWRDPDGWWEATAEECIPGSELDPDPAVPDQPWSEDTFWFRVK